MSDRDEQTLAVYAAKVQDYLNLTRTDGPDDDVRAFIAALPSSARVLDLGCGPGTSAAAMVAEGLIVDATDASAEMIALASQYLGVNARQASFSELEASDFYDGIFANFSLLHAPKADFPDHLKRIHTALKPAGILHLGMKLGTGESRDNLGRFYAYYNIDELTGFLLGAGFSKASALRNGSAPGLAGNVEPFVIMRAHV